MTVQQSPRLRPLPDSRQNLDLILSWNLEVWGERIPGYDQPAWRAFYQRALRANYQRFEVGAELVWIVEQENRCVGSIALVAEDDLPEEFNYSPWMAAFVIDPDLRGQGIGTSVVNLFEEQCRQFGINTLYLWTENSADWYATLGYGEIARTEFASMQITVMAKDLRVLP